MDYHQVKTHQLFKISFINFYTIGKGLAYQYTKGKVWIPNRSLHLRQARAQYLFPLAGNFHFHLLIVVRLYVCAFVKE